MPNEQGESKDFVISTRYQRPRVIITTVEFGLGAQNESVESGIKPLDRLTPKEAAEVRSRLTRIDFRPGNTNIKD